MRNRRLGSAHVDVEATVANESFDEECETGRLYAFPVGHQHHRLRAIALRFRRVSFGWFVDFLGLTFYGAVFSGDQNLLEIGDQSRRHEVVPHRGRHLRRRERVRVRFCSVENYIYSSLEYVASYVAGFGASLGIS